MSTPLLPLFLDLAGRRVLVVGAGTVAARKIAALLAVGATVEVVAIAVSAEVAAMTATHPSVRIERRAFQATDVDGAWLVIAATNDGAINAVIAAACAERRVIVNAVDDPKNASAFFGALVRRPPFTIAISSDGELPALARLLREIIESALPGERWIDAARALRKQWRDQQTPMESRFDDLVRTILGGR